MTTIKAFLKKYSSIPNAFINDFHSVYDRSIQDEFKIDLDVVSKWLKCQKCHLKATLLESYEREVDYIIIQNVASKKPGRKPEKILLTADCFKFLCMRSKTEKSQMVRKYYVELENLIEKYSTDFTEKLQQRIAELERNQKTKTLPNNHGVIYVIKASEKYNDIYKIGRSRNLRARLRAYNSGRMDDVDVVYIFETDMLETVETCTKTMLGEKQYRNVKEVYEVNIDVIKSVIKDCARLALKTRYKLSKPSKMTGGYYMIFDKAMIS